MSSNDEVSSDEWDSEDDEDDEEYSYDDESESSEEEEALSAEDRRRFDAVDGDANAAAVQQAIRDGANVNAVRIDNRTPLVEACRHGYDQIIRTLLDAGADARWSISADGWLALLTAITYGHLSAVQLLINHDNGLLKLANVLGRTPLFVALDLHQSEIVRFLLDSGADPHHVDGSGETTLMTACRRCGLEVVRLLLAGGVDVNAHNNIFQRAALHFAAIYHRSEIMLELILHHNANMCAVDRDGRTPFDWACRSEQTADVVDPLLEIYGNKLSQHHGSIALHELLQVAQYSFAEEEEFQPPLNPLQIILPLGKLRLKHLRTLLHTLDPELIRNRDDTGKLPIHIACRTNAPVEVLALILELDPAALHIADSTGALPIHLLLCRSTAAAATEYASVRYLVELGGVGTLAARNQEGLLPLHALCASTNPPWRTVHYLIESFPRSVAAQSHAGQYPFMVAASDSSTASLSVVYELVRANPNLVSPCVLAEVDNTPTES